MRIALSGPQHSYKKVQAALTGAGFKIVLHPKTGDPIPDSWGMDDPKHPSMWLTAEGTDANKAHSIVEPLGWRMRSQIHTIDTDIKKPRELTPEQKLAQLGLTKADLKSLLA